MEVTMYADYTELLQETFIDAIVGFGKSDRGLSEDEVKKLIYGILEASTESMELEAFIEDRLVPLLIGRIKDVE